MIVGSVLVILFALFFFVRKNAGPTFLAIIAGLSVYSLFHQMFTDFIVSIFPAAPANLVNQCLYIAFILIFPLILYFRSSRGNIAGLFRLINAGVLAILLTSLLSDSLATYFAFDVIARDIADFVEKAKGIVVLVGVIFAYIEILFYRKPPLEK